MTRLEFLLQKISEESVEISQAVSKIILYGFENSGYNNMRAFEEEVIDFSVALAAFSQEQVIKDSTLVYTTEEVEQLAKAKVDKLEAQWEIAKGTDLNVVKAA